MNLKIKQCEKLIVLGVMLITVSLSGVNGAVMKKKSGANSFSFYRTETLSFISKDAFNDKEGFMQKRQIDRQSGLYAPPPDGGNPIGSETPVEGHEIVFFLWAFVGFVLIKLKKNKITHL